MIRKLLYKFMRWISDYEYASEERTTIVSSRNRVRARDIDEENIRSNGMVFHLYAAEGGTVIETTFYDKKRDDNEHRLYIISDGESFNDTLGQIVSMERMRSWH